jgi:hypothetical protein
MDVVRVRGDDSVTSIPPLAFWGRKKLAEVELCEGLIEIWKSSFSNCDNSITKITYPTHYSGGLTTKPSRALFDVLFVSTMTWKALDI